MNETVTGKEVELSELCPPFPADTPCIGGGFASTTNGRREYIDCTKMNQVLLYSIYRVGGFQVSEPANLVQKNGLETKTNLSSSL
jgi:hypothetical protein